MRVLITGGSGFLAAWVARRLAARGDALRLLDLREERGTLAAIAGAAVAESAEWVTADIVSGAAVTAAMEGCDAVVHLAGLLTLACREAPLRGAEVNVIGTLNVFEAALALGIGRVVYTSSAAVFGAEDGRVPRPDTHYGAFKLACEGCARAYWLERGLASVGLRPYVVYGPGREGGLTADPTLACRAAARGEAFTIRYSGAAGMVYADDVAAAFAAALLREPEGALAFSMPGETVSVAEVVAAIEAVVPAARIGVAGPKLPSAGEIDEGDLRRVLPGLPNTRLSQGIAATVAYYQHVGRPG